MGVHITKYGLKLLYVRKVYYANNVWFCTRVNSPGIDTPWQNMHEDKVSKLGMWIVVEELRAHQATMAWGMVFGVVVPEVGDSRAPITVELTLTSAIYDPV